METVGGTGLSRPKLMTRLTQQGYEAVVAVSLTGVKMLTVCANPVPNRQMTPTLRDTETVHR